jgi:DNA-binding transcriptional ArsR family regulator
MDWERIARAFISPARLALLEELYNARGPLSPAMVARERPEFSVSLLAYHAVQLEKAGLIEACGERPRRGAIEHFYRLVDGF